MAAVAVQKPMTAQERVLAANIPPSREETHPPQSYHQRIAFNARGTGVAASLNGNPKKAGEPPQPPRKHIDPSEFLAGPTGPGHLKHGVRRFEEKDVTTVGKALTEEWILGRHEDDPIPPHMVKHSGPRDNLEGPCSVMWDEPPHRPLRAPGLSNHGYSAATPYHESEVPEEPLPEPPCIGKRRFAPRDNGDILSMRIPHRGTGASGTGYGASGSTTSHHRNRANESKDVLNLGQYTREQLNETERKFIAGPREFTPQNLPPRKRPTIARIKSAANETHDIFGTSQETYKPEVIHCKKRGGTGSKSERLDIFDTTPAPQQPPKPYCPSDLLDFNVPNVRRAHTGTGEPRTFQNTQHARQPEAKVETGSIFTATKNDNSTGCVRGRARGTCVPKPNNIF